MHKVTVEMSDMDDCDRATVQGLIARALAHDERLREALAFRGVKVFEVNDDEPRSHAEGTAPGITVYPGFPARVEATHASDCQFCAAGEPLSHTYEPPAV